MSNLLEKRSNSYPKNNRRKQNLSFLIKHKSNSPKKINNNNNNIKLIPKDFENENLFYFSFPIKPLEEKKIEEYFLNKNKKMYKEKEIINCKKITFQRQNDKNILEFNLFEDEMIFKDVNKAYLQDEQDDDGNISTDEKINSDINYILQELEESSKELTTNLKNNKKDISISRPIKFKKKQLNKGVIKGKKEENVIERIKISNKI